MAFAETDTKDFTGGGATADFEVPKTVVVHVPDGDRWKPEVVSGVVSMTLKASGDLVCIDVHDNVHLFRLYSHFQTEEDDQCIE